MNFPYPSFVPLWRIFVPLPPAMACRFDRLDPVVVIVVVLFVVASTGFVIATWERNYQFLDQALGLLLTFFN